MTNLLNAAKYYKQLPHQNEAWKALEARLPKHVVEEFMQAYRNAPKPTERPLPVPYEYQNDNASGTGYRECFSSSCAMLAKYAGKVRSDDHYNTIRSQFGDTTDAQAQLRTLHHLGLKEAKFGTGGSISFLKKEIDAGRPVAVGWLHQGHVSSPRGGGHWSVVIGYNDKGLIIHDPNGEANLVQGGYVNHSGGEGVLYSYKNWSPRWEVEGPGTGWYISV